MTHHSEFGSPTVSVEDSECSSSTCEFVSCTLQKCGQAGIKFTSSIHFVSGTQTVLKAAKLIQWQLFLLQWLCSGEAQLMESRWQCSMICQRLCLQGRISTDLPQPGLRPAAMLFHAHFRNVVRQASGFFRHSFCFMLPQTVRKAANLSQWQLFFVSVAVLRGGSAQVCYRQVWFRPA